MKKAKLHARGAGGLEVIEEAACLLRLVPVRTLAFYYTGSLPFVLGFLFFWSDMSRSAFAHQHAAEAAFSVAFLFIWMKFWQSVYCGHLRSFIHGRTDPPWSVRRMYHQLAAQAVIQSSSFIMLPLAVIMALPYAWVYAFYQNTSVYGNDQPDTIKNIYKKSLQQAKLFPRQNHMILLVLSVSGLFVFLNIWLFMYQVPHILKMMTGIETAFTTAGFIMLFNSTYLAVACCITYLVIDPLIKAVYTLRCFYGESVSSGEDLRVELSLFKPRIKRTAAALIVVAVLGSACFAHAAHYHDISVSADSDQSPRTGVAAESIDRAVTEVLSKREFSWRLPREKIAEDEHKGPIAAFIQGMIDTCKSGLSIAMKWLKKTVEWLLEKFSWDKHLQNPVDEGWMSAVRFLLYALLALVSCLLLCQLWRIWKYRTSGSGTGVIVPVPQAPDIADEQITADELPLNSWLELAQELMHQGKLRLAIRALYLASLSHLAGLNLITIAKSKSNHEYRSELSRNAHTMPDILISFSDNIKIFDRIWYGMHDVTNDIFSSFHENQQRIMSLNEK